MPFSRQTWDTIENRPLPRKSKERERPKWQSGKQEKGSRRSD